MRRFVIIGQQALASADFLLDDLPGTSGRLDVLVRSVRAALLVSHGVRSDAIVYLVLCGGARAPRVLRVEGSAARFLRPDERSLATLVQKSLAAEPDGEADRFVHVRPGISVRRGGLEHVLADLGNAKLFLLEPTGPDVRDVPELDAADVAFFVGDHEGFDDAARTYLMGRGARRVALGPVGVHAEDAVAIVSNELDRLEANRAP